MITHTPSDPKELHKDTECEQIDTNRKGSENKSLDTSLNVSSRALFNPFEEAAVGTGSRLSPSSVARNPFEVTPKNSPTRWQHKPIPKTVPLYEPRDPLIRCEQLAATLRSKKKQEILKYLRSNLRFDKFEISSASKFIRFGEMPRELLNNLRLWKVVHAIRQDT